MNKKQPQLISLAIAITFTLSSCTLSEGDPQITLCKKLTAHLMDKQSEQWGESSKTTLDNNAKKVSLNWDSKDANGTLKMTASCRYLADNDTDNEEYDMNSSDGYYTLPDSLTINGEVTDQKSLYIAIHKVTGQSIKETASEQHLRKKAAEANQAIREGAATIKENAEVLKQKAGEAAKMIQEESKELQHKAGEAMQKTGEYLQKD